MPPQRAPPGGWEECDHTDAVIARPPVAGRSASTLMPPQRAPPGGWEECEHTDAATAGAPWWLGGVRSPFPRPSAGFPLAVDGCLSGE
ncbi:hypothetical protein chiPu_0014710 [Chiloscyllium punctatum]|uniref:Uncharacterized protein n=1 Tax=Chiloscyllium punctatum TaxID=137246 RepID=A0A401T0R3_CHIPU|nr:hypothetical protein [Chiloscyllium punctatum]